MKETRISLWYFIWWSINIHCTWMNWRSWTNSLCCYIQKICLNSLWCYIWSSIIMDHGINWIHNLYKHFWLAWLVIYLPNINLPPCSIWLLLDSIELFKLLTDTHIFYVSNNFKMFILSIQRMSLDNSFVFANLIVRNQSKRYWCHYKLHNISYDFSVS